MIWNKKSECMNLEEKQELQLKRLQKTIKKAYEKVPFYKKKFDEVGIKVQDIESLDDISKLPFTTKTDLRNAYPFGMFAVPERDIIEIHTSSGTTGKSTVSGYTEKDLEIWAEVSARAITMALGTRGDKIQNCYGYGLFTGGLGIHYGCHKVGATVIPISAGNTQRQTKIMQDFQSTILTCTPSYALYLAENLEKEGLSPEEISLKSGIFGAEMWTEEMRDEIEERFGIIALNIYGLTEIIGPGVAQECSEKTGLHIFDDHFYPEIINSKTMESVPDGKKGELVLTTLTREATPLIRFCTKDITSLTRVKCNCGRTLPKMSRITGRTDDMLKLRGVSVFPSQIERALLKTDGISPNYQIVVTRPGHLDEVNVKVEASKELFSDEMKEMEIIEGNISDIIQKEIGLRVNVCLVEPKSISRSEGKAVRVIDERNLN